MLVRLVFGLKVVSAVVADEDEAKEEGAEVVCEMMGMMSLSVLSVWVSPLT